MYNLADYPIISFYDPGELVDNAVTERRLDRIFTKAFMEKQISKYSRWEILRWNFFRRKIGYGKIPEDFLGKDVIMNAYFSTGLGTGVFIIKPDFSVEKYSTMLACQLTSGDPSSLYRIPKLSLWENTFDTLEEASKHTKNLIHSEDFLKLILPTNSEGNLIPFRISSEDATVYDISRVMIGLGIKKSAILWTKPRKPKKKPAEVKNESVPEAQSVVA